MACRACAKRREKILAIKQATLKKAKPLGRMIAAAVRKPKG